MNFKRFKLCITNVTEGNVVCTDPVIQWFFGEDVVKSCEYADGCLEITILEDDIEGLKGKCITGTIACDNCEKCPPQDFEICFCETNDDCDDCEVCVNGVCQSACEDGQVCLDDACVDCSTDADCPNNKVCIGGKCLCPPNQPYEDEFGNCYGCKTDAECDPCERCIDGNCKPLTCGDDFVCDPNQDKCVECYNSGHCQNRADNKACCGTDFECECCPGYIFDANLGICVEEPECTYNDECASLCEQCVDGECTPVECPENYACDPLTGECEWNPCPDTPCTNGAECGEDCGCAGGMCVPCKDRNCSDNECEEALGCDCVNSICESADDNCVQTPCTNPFECGEGCTCYEGTCVSCDNFSCLTADCALQVGCKCEGTDCVGDDADDCEDVFTLEKIDAGCDLTATLETSNSCPCPVISVDSKYDSVYLDVTALAGTATIKVFSDYIISLRKGSSGGPLLDNTAHELIADNETPLTGTANAYIEWEVRNNTTGDTKIVTGSTSTIDLKDIAQGTIPIELFRQTSTLSGTSTTVQTFVGTTEIDTFNETVTKFMVFIETKDLTFPNGCNYNEDVNHVYRPCPFDIDNIGDSLSVAETSFECAVKSDVGESQVDLISTSSNRLPMFTWYKSEDNVFTQDDIFRKIYLSEDSTDTYIDTLYGPEAIDPKGQENLDPTGQQGELWANRYYQVLNDCSCKNQVSLDNKLVFCNPTDFDYSLTNCGTIITLDSPFTPCDVNGDLTNIVGINIPADVQVEYDIYINSVKVETFKGTLSTWTYTNPNNESITNIKIVQTIDDEEICSIDLTDESVNVPDPVPAIACSGGTFNATFNTSYSGVAVNDIFLNGVNIGGFIAANLERGVDHTFTVEFANDCVVTKVINEDCCDTFSVGTSISVDECAEGADATVMLLPNNGKTPYSWVITSGKEVGYTLSGTGTNPVIIPNFVAGVYTLMMTDAAGCEAQTNFTLSKQAQLTLDLDHESGIDNPTECANEVALFNISTNQPNGTLNYKIDSGALVPVALNANGGGSFSFNVGTTSKVVDVASVVGPVCTFSGLEGDYTQTVNVVTTPSAALSGIPANPCTNTTFTVTVTGDTGAVASLSASAGMSVPSTATVGDTFDVTPTVSGVGNITITSIELSGCTNSSPTAYGFTVSASPAINNWNPSCSVTTVGDIDISLTSVSGATVEIISPISANFVENPGGSGIFVYTYSQGAGIVVQVRSTVGSCSTVQEYTLPSCTCPAVSVDVDIDGGIPGTQFYECVGSTIDINASASGGVGGSYNYVWDINGSIYTGATVNNYVVPIGGDIQGSVTATDDTNNSCVGTQTFTLTGINVPIIQNIVASIEPDCVGGPYVFSATITSSGGSLGYTWGTDDGGATISTPNGSNTNITFSGDNGGSAWTVTLDVTETIGGTTCNAVQGTYSVIIPEPTEYSIAGDYSDVPLAPYGSLGTYFLDDTYSSWPFTYADADGCTDGGICGSDDPEGQLRYGLAKGTLTFTGLPSDGEQVVINATTYTFKNTLGAAYDVKIEAADAPNTLLNLVAAINLAAGESTKYGTSTLVHPNVTATSTGSLTMDVDAKLITDNWGPNAFVTTTTVAGASWGGATLSGGWGGQNQVPWDYSNGPSSLANTRMNQCAINVSGKDELVMTWTHAGGTTDTIGIGADDSVELWVAGTQVFGLTDTSTGGNNRTSRNWWVAEYTVNNGDCIHLRATSFISDFAVGVEFYDTAAHATLAGIDALKDNTASSGPVKATIDGYADGAGTGYNLKHVTDNPVTYSLVGYGCDAINSTPVFGSPGSCGQPECNCS